LQPEQNAEREKKEAFGNRVFNDTNVDLQEQRNLEVTRAEGEDSGTASGTMVAVHKN